LRESPADALVFTAQLEGGVIHPRDVLPAGLETRRRRESGISKRPRIHDLRHTYASYMAGRVSLPVLQRLLGHESITTTVDTYGHAMPADMAAAVAGIEEALAGALPAIES
jgi:integrase